MFKVNGKDQIKLCAVRSKHKIATGISQFRIKNTLELRLKIKQFLCRLD